MKMLLTRSNPEEWKTEALFSALYDQFGVHLENEVDISNLSRHELGETIFEKLGGRY